MMSEIQQIKNEVCQEHCKHYEKVLNEGYEEDAFFDRLADLYCNDCLLENLDDYVFTCADCPSKGVDCEDCPAYTKGYNDGFRDCKNGD